LLGVALGVLKFREEDFWAMTPRAFFNAFEANNKREEERFKREWEQARFIAVAMVNCWAKKPVSPTDYCHFPWEKYEIADPDEARKSFEYWYNRFKRIDERHGRN
jgi:hypothetical protein